MWLPWPLRLCFSKRPVVKDDTADTKTKGDAAPEQPITSPPRSLQPISESPVPTPAPNEDHQQLPSTGPLEDSKIHIWPLSDDLDTKECKTTSAQGIEDEPGATPHHKGTKHRPSQLSVDDIDLLDIRSPHPALQRTPVPVTPQSASSVSSSTLEILRTPMPFGSPVPDPARNTSLGRALGDHAGQKRPAAGQPGYTNLPYTVPFELRQHERPQSNPETPIIGPKRSIKTVKRPGRPSPLQSDSLANKASRIFSLGNPFQTPSPLESSRRYAVSSEDPDSTPHIFGLDNPATVYKENKAVRLRHTPFTERVDKEVQKERRFSERLSTEKAAAGQKT